MLEFYFGISVLELHNTHTSIYVYTVFKLHVLCRTAYVKINPNSKPIVHPRAGIRLASDNLRPCEKEGTSLSFYQENPQLCVQYNQSSFSLRVLTRRCQNIPFRGRIVVPIKLSNNFSIGLLMERYRFSD